MLSQKSFMIAVPVGVPSECIARHHGLAIVGRRRSLPEDGAPFLVGVLVEVIGAEPIEETD